MEISDYWEDIIIYEISFCRKGQSKDKKFDRIVAFPMDYSLERVKNELNCRFENEIDVLEICEIFEGMEEKHLRR